MFQLSLNIPADSEASCQLISEAVKHSVCFLQDLQKWSRAASGALLSPTQPQHLSAGVNVEERI